ncbi:hypothetical protein [Streptomyces bohaiensis]|uniref:hypothetical protein n=1 Tax=Streptomyces bohaiensis TaxID=1431344 RepID=UPI003B7D8E68
MGWTVLYLAFGLVALWLLGEVLLQYKARLRWRVLAFCGFLGVVFGVIIHNVPVIALGALAFATGQTLVTLSFRNGFSTGWSIGGKPGSSRRRRGMEPMAPVPDEAGGHGPPPGGHGGPHDTWGEDGPGSTVGAGARDVAHRDTEPGTARSADRDDHAAGYAQDGPQDGYGAGYGEDGHTRGGYDGDGRYGNDGGYGNDGRYGGGYGNDGGYAETAAFPAQGGGHSGYDERGGYRDAGSDTGSGYGGYSDNGGYGDGGYGNGGYGNANADSNGNGNGNGYERYGNPGSEAHAGGHPQHAQPGGYGYPPGHAEGGYPDPTTQGYGTQYPPPGAPGGQGPWPPPGPYYQETPPGGVWVPQQRDTVMPDEYQQAYDPNSPHQQGHPHDQQRY